MVDLWTLSSASVTGWGGWHTGQWWRFLWSWQSAEAGWRCACSDASQVCLRILSCAIWARPASGSVGLTKHSGVSFYGSLQVIILRKLNFLYLLYSNFVARYRDQILRFRYCATRQPSSSLFVHTEIQPHVGLFHLYPTSMTCHSSRHVDIQHEITYCL